MVSLHNNYIFLPQIEGGEQDVASNDEGERKISTGKIVSSHIRRCFGEPKNKKLCSSVGAIIYTYKINDDEINCNVDFTISRAARYIYLDICVWCKTKYKAIHNLTRIQEKLINPEIEKNYVVIISYDSISEYYCNKAYPKLNELERNLRKLLFHTYTVNFGTEYNHTTIDEEMQNKVYGIIQAKGGKKAKQIEKLRKFFYSMEFSDIEKLLFEKKLTRVEEKNKKEFLSENSDLSKLTDEKIRSAFEAFAPKSDWERMFANKADNEKVSKLIEDIRQDRNDIAHCKFFYEEQYKQFNKNVSTLNKTVLKAIKITEDEDFSNKNVEALNIDFTNTIDLFIKNQELITRVIRESADGIGYIALSAIKDISPLVGLFFKSVLDTYDIEEEEIE